MDQAAEGGETHINRQRRRSMSAEQRAELTELERRQEAARQEQRGLDETKKIVSLIEKDLQSSPFVDLVLRHEAAAAIITASREFFSEDVNAALLGGTFVLVGKVTAVESDADAETMVVRRGAMGLIANAIITPMLEQVRDSFAVQEVVLDLPDATVTGPYVQVIPLALYI